MRLIGLAVVFTLGLFTPLVCQAQQPPPGSVPCVGQLFLQPLSANAHLRGAFLQGLRELGYVEGQTSRSSSGPRTDGQRDFPTSRPNYSASRSTSSWPRRRTPYR